jgi:outer membrane protein assembly factor BamB
MNDRAAAPIPAGAGEPRSLITNFPGGLRVRATWGSSGQAAAVFALSEAGATLADHGALGAGAEPDPDRLCRMEMRVEHPGGAWAVRLASAIYDEPRALHWDEGGLFVVGYGFTVYAFASRTGELAWLHQTGTPVVALAASPRIDHVIVQSEVETWAIRADGEVKWRLAHTDVVGAAELIGGQLILTSIAGATQSIDPATGRALG